MLYLFMNLSNLTLEADEGLCHWPGAEGTGTTYQM